MRNPVLGVEADEERVVMSRRNPVLVVLRAVGYASLGKRSDVVTAA
ncbi:MAG: hypothetical protein GY722_26295 [bacterium]|nr:hypothetical protein [bacterium]